MRAAACNPVRAACNPVRAACNPVRAACDPVRAACNPVCPRAGRVRDAPRAVGRWRRPAAGQHRQPHAANLRAAPRGGGAGRGGGGSARKESGQALHRPMRCRDAHAPGQHIHMHMHNHAAPKACMQHPRLARSRTTSLLHALRTTAAHTPGSISSQGGSSTCYVRPRTRRVYAAWSL